MRFRQGAAAVASAILAPLTPRLNLTAVLALTAVSELILHRLLGRVLLSRSSVLLPLPYAERALTLDALKPLRRCGSFGRGDPIERAATRNFRHKVQPGDILKSAFAGNRKYALSWLFHLAVQYSSGAASYRDSLSNSTRPRWHIQSISQRACQRVAQRRPAGVVDARAESVQCWPTVLLSFSGMPCVSQTTLPGRLPIPTDRPFAVCFVPVSRPPRHLFLYLSLAIAAAYCGGSLVPNSLTFSHSFILA